MKISVVVTVYNVKKQKFKMKKTFGVKKNEIKD